MSGGRLVVLDRLGREVKRFPLGSGLATLGSHPRCDIRVMLSSVCPHHATVVVHTTQTVVRNVGGGSTLVNGRPVSVAALNHGDLITVGERHLRWEYTQPRNTRPQPQHPALYIGGRKSRGRRRGSAGGAPTPRSPSIQLALELQHRASMPGSASGKQVAIVQPQRRDTTEQNDVNINTSRSSSQAKRQRTSHPDESELNETRKIMSRQSPKTPQNLHSATKASMWIESRKTTPRAAKSPAWSSSARKAPPLRLAAMRRAASLTKLQNTPLDQTKQVAIMLMTGHTPKSKLSPNHPRRTPSFVVKKPSPVATPRGNKATPSKSLGGGGDGNTSRRKSGNRASTSRNTGGQSVSILEISDSTPRHSSSNVRSSRRSQQSPLKSPLLPTPKKSAMKDPTAKKSSRKTESIKFDLSNLENYSQDSEDFTSKSQDTISEDDLTLHYDTSSVKSSPSPRKSIHSRSSRILENSLGTSVKEPSIQSSRSTLTLQSPSPSRKSSRGSILIQKALESDNDSRNSRRTTKTLTDQSFDTTVASAFRTKTLSPRSPRKNLETYSIVDLVSIDSNESVQSGRSTSVYNSAGSANSSSAAFGTPNNSSGRKTRSTIDRALVDSSTPYVGKVTKKSLSRSLSSPNPNQSSIMGNNSSQISIRTSVSTRRSKSMVTPKNTQTSFQSSVTSRPSKSMTTSPEKTQTSIQTSVSSRQSNSMTAIENTLKHSMNSTRVSRSRNRSQINDSDLFLVSDSSYLQDESSISSKKSLPKSGAKQKGRTVKSSPTVQRKSSRKSRDSTLNAVTQTEGMSTPEQRHSPEDIGTPVLSIQSLLDSSQSSLASQKSNKNSRVSVNIKRKTIGVIRSEPKGRRTGPKSKSFGFTARRGLLRLSKDSSGKEAQSEDKMVTPKSAVKLVQEAVKNKHSTAKKPQSKRSIIDNLDESDIVKQLFNSPVKRKLSQSMTEFSRKQLFEDEEMDAVRRPTRNTVALTGRTPDNSVLEHTEVYTPERFVSPIGTPQNSPDLTGIKRLFHKNTSNNDLSDVRGVKALLRSPRTRKSVKNDLSNVQGLKRVFAKSPKNRLSDVGVKEVFAAEPENDLRRVSGIKRLFRSQKNKSPRNDLTDVRGVKKLFQKNSPANDLRRVSGVKRTLRNSPRNDLRDVRGVKRMYGEEQRKDDLNDVSGVEELFNESIASRDTDRVFDQLLGKPPIKAVYSKSFIKKKADKPKTRKAKSLHVSLDLIANNVEEWLEQELERRLHKDNEERKNRELQKLITDTVEGVTPIRQSRIRQSAVTKEVVSKRSASEIYGEHTLPIKKRSLENLDSSRFIRNTRKITGNSSRMEPGEGILPLKKRVLHSTPLKGKHPAPAVGTVSPIPTHPSHDISIRSDQQLKDQLEVPKLRRATRQKPDDEIKQSSPNRTRTTKTNKTKDLEMIPKTPNVEQKADTTTTQRAAKRKPSLVITKKTPVMSPKLGRITRRTRETVKEAVEKSTRGKQQEEKDSIVPAPELLELVKKTIPKKTKGNKLGDLDDNPTNLQESVKEMIPKNNRGKKRGTVNNIPTASSSKNTRGKTQVNDDDLINPSPKKTRGRQQTVQNSPSKDSARNTRTRRAVTDKPKENTPKRTRAKVQNAVVVVSKPSPQLKPRAKTETVTRKSRKTTINVTEETIKETKRRKVESPKVARSKRKIEIKPIEIEAKRVRKTRNLDEKANEKVATDDAQMKSNKEPKTTRGRTLKTQESTQSEPTSTRRRKNMLDNTVVPEVKSRKRKITSEPDVPNKISKKKANVGKTEKADKSAESEKTNARKTGKAKSVVVDEAINTRAKRAKVAEHKESVATRNKKTATAEPAIKTTRKKKNEIKASPNKPTPQKTRSTRAQAAATEALAKPTSRSRRR